MIGLPLIKIAGATADNSVRDSRASKLRRRLRQNFSRRREVDFAFERLVLWDAAKIAEAHRTQLMTMAFHFG